MSQKIRCIASSNRFCDASTPKINRSPNGVAKVATPRDARSSVSWWYSWSRYIFVVDRRVHADLGLDWITSGEHHVIGSFSGTSERCFPRLAFLSLILPTPWNTWSYLLMILSTFCYPGVFVALMVWSSSSSDRMGFGVVKSSVRFDLQHSYIMSVPLLGSGEELIYRFLY